MSNNKLAIFLIITSVFFGTVMLSFLNLVFASIIGYFVFDEMPDLYTWIGALIIFIGVLIISYREMKLDKDIIRKRVDIKS